MDCCTVAVILASGYVLIIIVLIIVAFRYTFRGKVKSNNKDKEFSIKLTPPKRTTPKNEIKLTIAQDKKKKKTKKKAKR